jgi:hypothetical protein
MTPHELAGAIVGELFVITAASIPKNSCDPDERQFLEG